MKFQVSGALALLEKYVDEEPGLVLTGNAKIRYRRLKYSTHSLLTCCFWIFRCHL
jgi:hypothetical protein